MTPKTKPCLVACSVFEEEIKKLIENDELDVDVVFVSKYFHEEFAKIERNLRPAIENALKNHPKNVILVYGDLCLGMKGQMNKLAEEYGIFKIDALNCVDCQLGGKGKYLEADPNQEMFFLSPGMMDSFGYVKDMMIREGLKEADFRESFKDLRGFVILDTLGNSSKIIKDLKKFGIGLEILETRYVGCENVKNVIQETIEKNNKFYNIKKTAKKSSGDQPSINQPKIIEREKKMVEAMIQIYCKDHHNPDHLPCMKCSELEEYSKNRLDNCRYQEKKPVCGRCGLKCYNIKFKSDSELVFRYAGPRMFFSHPRLGLQHIFDSFRNSGQRK